MFIQPRFATIWSPVSVCLIFLSSENRKTASFSRLLKAEKQPLKKPPNVSIFFVLLQTFFRKGKDC